MDIIHYLLQLIQYLYQQNCWLINFICRYIPLKQWAFDDSHSPKYQKFKVDELPLVTDFRQDWTYKELIPYYEKRYGRKIRPISRRSECDIPDDCSCPRCDFPAMYIYLFPFGFQYTFTTLPQLGHFSDTMIHPKPVSPISQARFLHRLSGHFIFRIIPPPLPPNTSIAISPH